MTLQNAVVQVNQLGTTASSSAGVTSETHGTSKCTLILSGEACESGAVQCESGADLAHNQTAARVTVACCYDGLVVTTLRSPIKAGR